MKLVAAYNGTDESKLALDLAKKHAKIFNAKAGDIVGPMQLGDEGFFEIVLVLDFHPAELTDNIRDEVSKSIYQQWLSERAKDVTIKIS